MPFDFRTPIGYFIGFCMEVGSYAIMINVMLTGLGGLFANYAMMMSFGQTIRWKFRNLNEHYCLYRTRTKLLNELYDVIQFHAKVKELSIFLSKMFGRFIEFKYFLSDWPVVSYTFMMLT